MNAMVYGGSTGEHDWIPDRAIGPTDDALYLAEKDYHDQELSRVLGKPLPEIAVMESSEKREILINNRKEQLRKLIQVYYQERDWNASGIPTIDTLKRIGLWDFLNEEVMTKISELLAA
jgi:aldehyde:ferredoxin oxidoreductase